MCVNVIMMRDSDAVAAPHLATPFMGLQLFCGSVT